MKRRRGKGRRKRLWCQRGSRERERENTGGAGLQAATCQQEAHINAYVIVAASGVRTPDMTEHNLFNTPAWVLQFYTMIHCGYFPESLLVHVHTHWGSDVPPLPGVFSTMHTSVQVWTACLSTQMHSSRIHPPTHWQVVPNLWDFDRWQIKSLLRL